MIAGMIGEKVLVVGSQEVREAIFVRWLTWPGHDSGLRRGTALVQAGDGSLHAVDGRGVYIGRASEEETATGQSVPGL